MDVFSFSKKDGFNRLPNPNQKEGSTIKKTEFPNQASGGGEETGNDRRWVRSSFTW
jgi:hypothetical protein